MDKNSLTHYGVMGMKWGRRKSKPSKGSNSKSSSKKSSTKKTSNVKKKLKSLTSKIDKDKVKSVAKTTAIIGGSVASAALLGALGNVAFNEVRQAVINNNFDARGYYDADGNKHLYKDNTRIDVTSSYNSPLGSGHASASTRYGTRDDGTRVLLGKIRRR